MNRELRPHQQQAIALLRSSLASGHRRPVLQAATGFGKTLLAAAIVEGALRKSKRVLFTVPAISLIDQTVNAFFAEGLTDIGVMQGQHEMTDWSKPVQVASIQTLMRRDVPKVDIVVNDECFAGKTLIETANGPKKIDLIRVGDKVFNATGFGYVLDVFQKLAETIRINFSDGRSVDVTRDHPFFTDRGWVKAEALGRGSCLMRPEDLLELWNSFQAVVSRGIPDASGELSSRKSMAQASILLNILFEEACKSDERECHAIEDAGYTSEDKTCPNFTRRQREAVALAAIGAFARFRRGVGGRISCENPSGAPQRKLSELLQTGHSKLECEGRDRTGWSDSFWQAESFGREEGRPSTILRVESISNIERANHEPVFNLHVSGHPSYFAGGVLVHNCHRWFEFMGKWMADPAWQAVPFIGLSATPWTRGLGKFYDDLLIAATTSDLIRDGYLAPFRVYAPSHPDLSQVRTVAGDYHEGDLGDTMNQAPLVADAVDNWIAHGEGRPTFCFAVDRAHARHLQERFQAAGVPCGYVDAYTDQDERDAIARQFGRGDLKVVCNVGCLTTGVDWDVRCIILARPTKSEMLFVQMIGRGLRTAIGKTDLIVFDHSDTHARLGFVTDISHDKLDDGRERQKAAPREVAKPRECPQCKFLRSPKVSICPACGFKAQRQCDVEVEDGELVEFGVAQGKAPQVARVDRQRWYSMLLQIGEGRGYKPGWASAQFKAKFGGWPDGLAKVPIEPSPEVVSYVRSRMIAFAKSRGRAA